VRRKLAPGAPPRECAGQGIMTLFAVCVWASATLYVRVLRSGTRAQDRGVACVRASRSIFLAGMGRVVRDCNTEGADRD
jgi:hypothetical protein